MDFMKTKLDVCTLEDNQVAIVSELFDAKEFKEESILHYEGQVPVVAYYVQKGGIELIKNNKSKLTVRRGQILGLKELVSHTGSGVKAVAKSNSLIYFIDFSTIREILNSAQSMPAKSLITNLLEAPFIY